ncbi:MAG: transposase [Lachnospiraceae bacterium]|nr:transposase [Lachnospiraceae bacterium]
MPRKARCKSSTGIYHIIIRGADRRVIFSDDEDNLRFLKVLFQVKKETDFLLYAYCLMGNHAHFLIKEGEVPLGVVFKKIGCSYVYYYNRKYQLHGHLFQDRFKSENVETWTYFMNVIRYICQNPVKADICHNPFEYPWTGCYKILDKYELLDSFDEYYLMGKEELMEFIVQPSEVQCMEDLPPKRLTDREATEIICKICMCSHVQDIGGWEKARRNQAIVSAIGAGISIRQFSRLTAISKTTVERVVRR